VTETALTVKLDLRRKTWNDRGMKPCLILAALVAVPPGARAEGPRQIDCYCRDGGGGRVEMGEVSCLFVDGRAFQARCEMVLNNLAWRETGDGCTLSALPPDASLQRRKPVLDPARVHTKI
jgi:hypothetical protein